LKFQHRKPNKCSIFVRLRFGKVTSKFLLLHDNVLYAKNDGKKRYGIGAQQINFQTSIYYLYL